jgi:hypothetical protein
LLGLARSKLELAVQLCRYAVRSAGIKKLSCFALLMEPNGALSVSKAGMLGMNAARVTKFEKLSPAPDPQDQTSNEAVRAIGRALGAHYSDLVQAPLPDKLLDLLAKLGDEPSTSKANGSDNAVG